MKVVYGTMKDKLKLKISVIIGMHAEKTRLSPAGPDNEFGENSVRRKIAEMEEIFPDSDLIDWELVFVAHANSPDKKDWYQNNK